MSYKSEFISNNYFGIISSKRLVPYANSKHSVKDSLYKPCINHESYKIQIVVRLLLTVLMPKYQAHRSSNP